MDSGTTVPRPISLPRVAQSAALWRLVVAHRARIALTTITVAGLSVRLWDLASKSLWIDETFSIGMVTQSWPSFLHTIGGVQPNMELFYVLLKLAVTLTPAAWQSGESFWRMLPALAGAATIPAVYALVRRLFPTRVALAAAALLAVNEFMVEYSQQARGYTLFVLILTLSYLALVRWLEGSRQALIWFGVLTALGFLTQAFEVVFLTAQIAFILLILLYRRSLAWRGLLAALAPLAVIVAVRYPIYAAHPDQVSWIVRPTTSDLYHGMRQLIGGDGGIPTHIGDLLLATVLVGMLVLIGWAWPRPHPPAPSPLRWRGGDEAAAVGQKPLSMSQHGEGLGWGRGQAQPISTNIPTRTVASSRSPMWVGMPPSPPISCRMP